jgi:predicted amidohydrolase
MSYGHSLIIDPWGTIVAECADGEGFCLAPMDTDRLKTIREQIPMDTNRAL